MSEFKATPPEPDDEAIRPVAVNINPQNIAISESSDGTRLLPVIILGALLAVLAAVVLVLPSLIDEPEPDELVLAAQPKPSASTAPPEKQKSPWEEAQIAKAREAAKAALDSILDSQFTLQELGVAEWAGEEFASALVMAREGDEAYRRQEFVVSAASYQQAGQMLAMLLGSAISVYEQQLAWGNQALAAGDAELAGNAFRIALQIRPEDEAAELGLQRATVLDQVVAETSSAELALRMNNLEAALTGYGRALKLDPNHQAAREGMQRARSLQTPNRFGRAMSEGYAALNAHQYDAARKQFSVAAKTLPGSKEAREAIAQVDAASTLEKLERLLNAGQKAEFEEDWEHAVEQFRAALAIDPSLLRAQEAVKIAETRLRLDQVLREALEDPLGLVDENRYQTTLRVLRKASTMDNPGPRLTDQLRRLAIALRQARTPQAVSFASDNQTVVNLLRVQQLGRFDAKKLNLNPGTYVVLGRRSGFRDVRHEFVIEPGQRPPLIDVRCTERI